MTEEFTEPKEEIGNLIVGTRPELKAKMKQNWEIISFFSESGEPDSYSAVSTAAVFPPVPFETFIPASAERVSHELMVEGMETFIFDHGHDERPRSHYGKTSSMEGGCMDHFSSITQTLYHLSSYPRKLSENISKEPSNTYRILTFVYKPKQNGWIVVETSRRNGETKTYIYSRANKADLQREVRGQETLYFDSSEGQEVEGRNIGLRTHFRIIINEIENNLGYFLDLKPVDFDRIELAKEI